MSEPTGIGNPFRRTAVVAAAALLATAAATVLPGFASAKEEFVSGSGKAKASILRIGPSSARLSLAPSVGVALADHLGVLGRGESLIVDYAALDGTVQDDVPKPSEGQIDPKGKQIPPLRVESTEEGSAAGREQRAVPFFVQRARADTRPFGFSSAELEVFDIPGLLHIGAGRADAYSGVVEIEADGATKTVREAGGVVDIAELRVGSDTLGHINITGLHWEAFQRTDENDDTTPELVGDFTFGSMTILDPSGEVHEFAGPTASQISGGMPQEMKDGLAQFAAETGLHLRLPELLTTGGVTRLTPLGVSIIESPAGQQVFGPIQEGIAPVRNEVTSQWLTNCAEQAGDDDAGNCGLPFLVADLAIGPVAGGGRFDIEVGGVNGFTEGEVFEGFDFNPADFAGFDDTGFSVAPVDTGSGSGFDPSVLGVTETAPDGTTATGQPAAVPETGDDEVAAPQPLELTGSVASGAWAVGLIGLGAAITMAAADYRRLRSKRRLITPIS